MEPPLLSLIGDKMDGLVQMIMMHMFGGKGLDVCLFNGFRKSSGIVPFRPLACLEPYTVTIFAKGSNKHLQQAAVGILAKKSVHAVLYHAVQAGIIHGGHTQAGRHGLNICQALCFRM